MISILSTNAWYINQIRLKRYVAQRKIETNVTNKQEKQSMRLFTVSESQAFIPLKDFTVKKRSLM